MRQAVDDRVGLRVRDDLDRRHYEEMQHRDP